MTRTPFAKRYLRALLVIVYTLFAHPLLADVKTLAGGRLSITIQHTDVAEVFEMLSRHGRVNILLGANVSGEVSINLYDVTVSEAINTIATASGYAVERTENVFFIVGREEAGKDIAGALTAIRSFKVQYSDPEAVAEILENHLSRYGKITTLPERKLLIVEELPDFMARLETLLGQLDHQPTQILIEARILEITLDSTDTFGIDWSKLFDSGGGSGSFGLQGLAATGAPGLFFTLVNPNIEAALSALTDMGRVRTLSTPKLLALEHEEAEVIIGDRIGYRVTTTINQVTTESIEFLESGIILNVQPYVDRNGRIMMDIHPEVSTGTITNDGVPNQTTTEVTTQLLADDGQTIFIGGLMRSTVGDRRAGAPLISKIPLLGRLFRNSEKVIVKTETVVLITPRVIPPGSSEPHNAEASRLDSIGWELDAESFLIEKIFEGMRGHELESTESASEARPDRAVHADPWSEADLEIKPTYEAVDRSAMPVADVSSEPAAAQPQKRTLVKLLRDLRRKKRSPADP